MKAQVLRKYDPEMKEGIWVANEEMPDPKIEKASDVIVKIGAAGVCRTDLHIIEGVWKHRFRGCKEKRYRSYQHTRCSYGCNS